MSRNVVTTVRGVLGVLVGGALWLVLFFSLARLLLLGWADYGVSARAWMASQQYTFTPVMSVFNASFWVLAEIGAGLVAAAIAGRKEAVWALAVLLMGYLCYAHLYVEWNHLPNWYNLLVALPSGPAVLLGGRLAQRLGHRTRRTAPA
ncbi:MAG TPA: hypothetical protein VGM84_14565 [Steroidobacteraceae bacterium]|jgi:hypothetical protein